MGILNDSDKFVIYLDPDTLGFMFLNYTGKRNYRVMTKLHALLHEGFVGNTTIVPISMEHVLPYIRENKVDTRFLSMMGEIGQVQFLQRFTVRTLQLIRIINHYFEHDYRKPRWKDAFSSDPDEKYYPGFNKYSSITASNVLKAYEREKKYTNLFQFIDSYRKQKPVESVVHEYFTNLWEQFPEIIRPYLPPDGVPEYHMESFLGNEEIKEIPEFHIKASILYQLIDAYGIEEVERGMRDEILLAAENISTYMPYCHFFVTTVDVAEPMIMSGINDLYYVKVYDHNESSLYKLIHDVTEAVKARKSFREKEHKKTIFRREDGKHPY